MWPTRRDQRRTDPRATRMAQTGAGKTRSGSTTVNGYGERVTYPDPYGMYGKTNPDVGCADVIRSSRVGVTRYTKRTDRSLFALPVIKNQSVSRSTRKDKSANCCRSGNCTPSNNDDYGTRVSCHSTETIRGRGPFMSKTKKGAKGVSCSGSLGRITLKDDVKGRQSGYTRHYRSTVVKFVTADVKKPLEATIKQDPCSLLRMILSTPETYNTPEVNDTPQLYNIPDVHNTPDVVADSRSTPGLQDDVLSVCTIHLDKLETHVTPSTHPEYECGPRRDTIRINDPEEFITDNPIAVLRDSLTSVPLSDGHIGDREIVSRDVKPKSVSSPSMDVQRNKN
ncbi:hypothetical protein LSH36_8g06007 [Paralvinella palmiformis]|uniref:Uncharacterized protein n=1 Tax=Paralvinella palmiformis TaxID=53620 RepID=A0AAD9NIC5_9ANNE|nr:hypothetical protein LSH36_8g06007 [Paralvinella palmiformis]